MAMTYPNNFNPVNSPYPQQPMMGFNYPTPAQPTMPYPQTNPNPTPQVPPVRGYFINSEQDILARDVPMDGTIAFFPLMDGSMIIGKRWNGNGQIETLHFKQTEPATSNHVQDQDFQSIVMEKLNDIQSQLKRRSKPNQPRQQKEAENA